MRKIITCLASSLIVLVSFICSSAFAEPYLWSAHNTAVDMKDGKADLSTARFFALNLEIADDDDDNELPYLEQPDFYDFPFAEYDAPKLTLDGGKYSYWSNNKMEKVSGTKTEFNLMRTDSLTGPEGYYRHIGTNNPAYTPISYEGRRLQFLYDADNGLNNINVSWNYNDKTGSASIPEFMTTSEQLAGVVPYVEYVINQDALVTAINWRFVNISDVTKAVSVDVDMTIEIRGCYNNGNARSYEENFVLYDGIENTLVTKKAGETLEGSINLEDNAIITPFLTVLRYYAGSEKNKCYQWRYFTCNSDPSVRFYSDALINVPIEDGKVNYNHAYYAKSNLAVVIGDTVYEAKYLTEGTITVEAGGYSILDNLNLEIDEVKENETRTFSLLQTAESLGDSYLEFGISREMTHPYSEWYEWTIAISDETGEKLSGKKISWTFPGELSHLSGTATYPKYMSIKEMMSSTGFFPHIELVMEDNKVTAIKYNIVQSPDLDVNYAPDVLCYFDDAGIFDHAGNFQSLRNPESDVFENFNPYHNWTLTLETPVDYNNIDQIQAYFRVYPNVKNSKEAFDEWLNAGNDHNDERNFIRYGWSCRTDFFDARAVLIRDDDFRDMSSNIANILNTDTSNIHNVTRDEIGGESRLDDELKAKLESGDAIEVLGGIKGIHVSESGDYATKINILQSDLLDELQGTASADIQVLLLTDEDLMNMNNAQSSGRVKTSDNTGTQARGQLLNEDGTAIDTVDTKKFIVALSLPKSDYYNIYIARSKNKPQTPKEVIEVVSQDEAQKIDSGTQDKLVNIISGDNKNNYEIKTFNELAASGGITDYRPGAKPDSETLNTLSKDFTGFELVNTLPAFTLSTDKPVILIMKVSADIANQVSLHFYKRKGATVTGVSRQVVRLSETVDMSEDKEAKFYNSNGEVITELLANTVYVSSVFDKGSYAPLVITGTAKDDTQDPKDTDPKGPIALGSSSGGCNSLFASGALVLAFLMFVKNRRGSV